MKITTLQSVRDSLAKNQFEIILPDEVARQARKALEKMMELS